MKKVAFGKLKFKKLTILFAFFLLASGLLILFILLKPQTQNRIPTQIFEKQNFSDFKKYAKNLGAEKTYSILKKQYQQNQPQAHDFAHIIGLVAFEQIGGSGLAICDAAFNYGCYHGFIEEFISKKGVSSVKEIEEACNQLGRLHAPSCLHGIGHGLMIDSSYNLEKALTNCDLLNTQSQIFCWDGVFMERITGSMLSVEKRLVVNKTNLDEPCLTIRKIYKKQCWRNQVSVWFNYYQQNTQKVGETCARIEAEFRQTCYESIGLVSVINFGENAEKLINSCKLSNNRAQDNCFFGAIKELLFEGKSPELARSLCLNVSHSNRKICHSLFEKHYIEYQERFGG